VFFTGLFRCHVAHGPVRRRSITFPIRARSPRLTIPGHHRPRDAVASRDLTNANRAVSARTVAEAIPTIKWPRASNDARRLPFPRRGSIYEFPRARI
jgi:hypothetical protein